MYRRKVRKQNQSRGLQPSRSTGRTSSKKKRRREWPSALKKTVLAFIVVLSITTFHVKTTRSGTPRLCTSPEATVPWVMDGQCVEEPILSALNKQRSCGLCGRNTFYLKNVRDGLEVKYKKQCKDLIVYGACLGSLCKKMLQKKNEWRFVERPGTCFFMFVGGISRSILSSHTYHNNNLIIVDLKRMPFKSNRRNVKVLKFSPGLLFPWADRVIWQDAKLPSKLSSQLPKDYMLHFNRTAQHYGACASFMGLPRSEASVGSSENVTLRAQCNTVIAAAKKRPSVSDSIDSVRRQCEIYMRKKVSQAPLVDTAFIVYDMRSPTCRKFNGDFLCSWLDEIHCHSDRDQISFPLIIDTLNLKLSSELEVPGLEYRDQVYVDKNENKRIHIAKRSCHWYYNSFSRCVAHKNQSSELYDMKQNNNLTASFRKKIRVAVIVAGTLQRFMFNSTLEHVFKRKNEKGQLPVNMDYYVSLTTQKAKAYRSNNIYTNYFEQDPVLPKSKFSDYVDIEEYIRDKVGSLDASIGAVTLQESIDIDSEPLLKARRAEELRKHPRQDPDTQFPLFDIRSEEIAYRTANANRNFLRLHLSIQSLWNQAVMWEQEEGFKYDYIMFMRDDSLWLDDFNIHNLHNKNGDIYIPSCNARDPPMAPSEINDHILISKRNVADLFGNYYKTLYSIDVTKCMMQLPDTLRKKDKRGCNSKMLLKYVTEENYINVMQVSQSDIPFQRSANIKIPNVTQIQCFHKYCQSHESPLNTRDMKKCADIDWESKKGENLLL